jgi:cytosine/uracil/thiamine/allantoin permease
VLPIFWRFDHERRKTVKKIPFWLGVILCIVAISMAIYVLVSYQRIDLLASVLAALGIFLMKVGER